MAPGQLQVIAKEVDEEQPRFHLAGEILAVDIDGDFHHEPPCARVTA